MVLPWGHRVAYAASVSHPFSVGGIHIAPQHLMGEEIVFRAAHGASDPLHSSPSRQDCKWYGYDIPRMLLRELPVARELVEFAELTERQFRSGRYNEYTMRSFATLIVACLLDRDRVASEEDVRFEIMSQFVRDHISRPLRISEICSAASCSSATASRVFRNRTGMSVGAWVRHERVHVAQSLLRSTGLSVREVATVTGFADPLYFSRVFRQETGMTPSSLSKSARLL